MGFYSVGPAWFFSCHNTDVDTDEASDKVVALDKGNVLDTLKLVKDLVEIM